MTHENGLKSTINVTVSAPYGVGASAVSAYLLRHLKLLGDVYNVEIDTDAMFAQVGEQSINEVRSDLRQLSGKTIVELRFHQQPRPG